jgi:hypothetical protein
MNPSHSTLNESGGISVMKPPESVTSDVSVEEGFDDDFRYKRRIKHISPVFEKVDFSLFNFIQVAVLLTEFVQIASFPLRDLFRSTAFLQSLMAVQGASSRQFIETIRGFFSIFSTGLITIDFNYVKFVICWWYTLIAFAVAFIFIIIEYAMDWERTTDLVPLWVRKTIDRFTTGSWVLMSLPLVNLFYLIILNAFLEPLGCLSSNTTPTWPVGFEDLAIAAQKRLFECAAIHDTHPSRNTWYSLSGFTLAFLLFTICRTAQEPIPEQGIINYTSRSELYTKSASIVLLLLYTLVPTQETTTVRGTLASIILFSMILYNVVIGSTFSRWVNFSRTLSYLACFWMSVVITFYTHNDNTTTLFLTGSGVWSVLAVGTLILWAVYTALYFLFIKNWETRCAEQPKTDMEMTTVPPSEKDEDSLSRHSQEGESTISESQESSVTDYSLKRSSLLVHSMQPTLPSIYVHEERRKPLGPRPMRSLEPTELHFPVQSVTNAIDSMPRSTTSSTKSPNRSPT